MKHRFWLFKRRGVFYVEDTLTRKQESLGTSNRNEAQRLRSTKDAAAAQPSINLAIGKAYIAAYNLNLVEWKWQMVMDEFQQRGKESTRRRKERSMRSRPFRLLSDKKLIETTADEFRQVIASGGSSTNHYLRCLHNLALGMGWLSCPIIPPRLWPTIKANQNAGSLRKSMTESLRLRKTRNVAIITHCCGKLARHKRTPLSSPQKILIGSNAC